jgi:type IV conjugative transfer system coupling protein TraD
MQKLEPTTLFKDLTRGGQTFMHGLRMSIQVFRYGFFSALGLFLCLVIILTYFKTTPYSRYLFYEYGEAEVKILFNDKTHTLIKNPKGVHPPQVNLLSVQFIKEPTTQYHIKQCMNGFAWAIKWSAILSINAFFLFLFFLKQKGKRAKASEMVLGQGRVTPKALKKQLYAENEASTLTIAGVPLVLDSEVQHILLAGTTGTGKSVCMQELMDQVREQKQKAIIFDIDGTLVANYYRSQKDILLNALDERCPSWNIWQECRDKADYETIAHSLMPLHLSGNDPFWINAAHTIFTEVAEKLSLGKNNKNAHLLDALFTQQLDSLSRLVSGTPAEALVSERNEKTALSIKATLSTYCKSLLYLRDDSQDALFSIRRWIEADAQDSWLFIATDAQKIDALKPLLSVWLDVAAKSVLSLPPYSKRRLWFFADELPKLHRLPSLMNLLERGRKYGACFVGSVQDVHQVHSVYGRNDAETLTSLFNTKIFFRSSEPQSIAWMSKVMGGLEFVEKKEGFSYGANDMRDGVSIHQERRREPIVKEAEFSELPDLHAFLKLPGAWPVTEIALTVKKRTLTQPYFIPRLNQNPIPEIIQNIGTSQTEQNTKPTSTVKRNPKKSLSPPSSNPIAVKSPLEDKPDSEEGDDINA